MGGVGKTRRFSRTERLAAGSRWRDNGLVFTTGIGTPPEPRALNKDFDRIVGSVKGLRRVRLHDLRHACARFMIAQGVHPRVIMELLGHSQISLTMNTYSHVLPDAMKQAVCAVESLLGTATAAG
jgi:integrase